MKFTIEDIKPMGCVRMTRRGKFTSEAAKRYLSFKSLVSFHLKRQMKSREPIKNPVHVKMTFYMPIPKSKRKTKAGDFHMVKPDIDNVIKSVFDAANKIIWTDDNLVVSVVASKVYSDTQGIELEVYEL